MEATQTASAMPIASLCHELALGFQAADCQQLEAELGPYTQAMFQHLASGEEIPSHIRGASSLCVPITTITHPDELFAQAEGTVQQERYTVQEYDTYWVTTHFSTVPVVILLLKQAYPELPRLADLCARCGQELGYRVGGNTGAYFQWNQPGFGWRLHTDDEYEGVSTRVHLPLITTPQNTFCWADRLDAPENEWLLSVHLERGKVYAVRTDIPHTAINRHPSAGRLHLILDVTSEPYGS